MKLLNIIAITICWLTTSTKLNLKHLKNKKAMATDLKSCIREIEKGDYENQAGKLKNLVAWESLKEIVQANNSTLDINEITMSDLNIKGRITRMRVESGWLYNFWDMEKDDYSKEWVFVPRL